MNDRSLKPGWTRVAFGEMAVCVNERIDNPASAGVDRYVGLEHLDSNSLTIRRWGSPNNVTAAKLRFRKGDIIFGRRRVYQRKLAVANFDGICSAHAMVLRAKKSQVVLPEYLPVFMQSDPFMDRAKTISVGSLSPTINWKTLEKEEFVLPPLDEQRRLARAMAKIVDVDDTLAQLNTRIDELLVSVYTTIFDGNECQRFQLKEFADVRMGRQRAPRHESGSHVVPYLRAANIRDGKLDLTSVHEMNFNPSEQKIFRLRSGDILISEGCGSRARIGDNAVWNGEITGPVCFQNTVIRVRARERISPELLKHWARYAFRSGLFQRTARGTSILHIGHERCEQLPINLPKTAEDRDCALFYVRTLENAALKIRERTPIARTIKKYVESYQ